MDSSTAARLPTPAAAPARDAQIARPRNDARAVFHAVNASIALLLLEVAPWPWIIGLACAGAIAAWSMELSRKASPSINAALMRVFAPIAHPHEFQGINSATWYVTSLALLSSTQQLIPCAIALVTLGLGDPAAATVGRRWGRFRWSNGRSVEGTLAFILLAGVASVTLLVTVHGLALGPALSIAGAASVLGAMAELWSKRIDDNLSIPVSAWLGAYVVCSVLL